MDSAIHTSQHLPHPNMPTNDELLQQAAAAHKLGDLDGAEQLARQALEVDARQADAWHQLGRVAQARGQGNLAVERISQAIRLEGGRAGYHRDLAEALLAQARLVEAEQSCRQALRLDPNDAAAHHVLSVIFIEQGRREDALASCRRALELNADFAPAHASLARALHELGRLDEAAAACRRAITCDPMGATHYHELARILQEQGDAAAALEAFHRALAINPYLAEAQHGIGTIHHLRAELDQAVECYLRALSIQPNYADAHCNLGSALKDRGQFADAVRSYQRALECDPALPEAHFNLGVLLQRQGRDDAAIACYESAIRANPHYAQAYNNLGTLYSARNELDRAAEFYSQTLALKPGSAEALNNLGNIRKVQGQVDEARNYYERSLEANSKYAQAHHNRSLLLLAEGDYARGWKEYEWRWKCPDFVGPSFDGPRWQGEPLAGRTLLIHAEQGLGDTLQFVRFAPPVVARGGKIKLEVQPSLKPLLKQAGWADSVELLGQDDPPGSYDFHLPLLSVPGILGITPGNIPSADGYLSADPRLVDQWSAVLAGGAPLKVGIAWQGKATHRGDRFRSIPLAHFAPLAREGVELVSLQKGFGAEQLEALGGRFPVRTLGPDFDAAHGAFMDTAAVMKSLDLVITSDTVIAHLAGALGVPVWVALTVVPDWRWMHNRADSPWYTSATLFRQTRIDDWPEVFERMAQALATFPPRR